MQPALIRLVLSLVHSVHLLSVFLVYNGNALLLLFYKCGEKKKICILWS